MTLEGLLPQSGMPKPTGRLLEEALPGGSAHRAPAVREAFELALGTFRQRIERLSYEGRAYVTCGSRISSDGWTPEHGRPVSDCSGRQG